MAVIGRTRKRFWDFTVLLTLSFLLISSVGRTLAQDSAPPTVTQCRSHIEAAIRDYAAKDQQPTTQRQEPAETTTERDDDGDDDDDITVQGDTPSLGDQDDQEDQTAQDDDDEQTAAAEDGDDQTAAEDGDDQTAAEGEDDQTVAEGEEGDEQTAEGEDDEQTVAEGEDDEQTAAEGEDDEQTAAADDEKTGEDGDEQTVTEGEEGDDEQTVAEGDDNDEQTVAEGDDEQTIAEDDDEQTVAEGDDDQTAAEGEDDDQTVAEDDDDDDQTAAADEGQTEGDEEDTVAEDAEQTAEGEDEQTVAEGAEDDDDDDEQTAAGDDDEADDNTVADDEATQDENEGEEATDDAHAEATAHQDEGESVAPDEQSGDDGQDGGDEDAASVGDDATAAAEDEGGDDAVTEGDQDGGDGESQADQPEEEQEEDDEEDEEETVKEPGRSHDHINEILGLDDSSMKTATSTEKAIHDTLKELKKMYENAIKPMEILYKFKDISNRFVGDAEIFSKPMILFIGPWSSGKSTIINYLLDTEDTKNALRTGAEPHSNAFTVLTFGETEQVLDGTELAADWTFSTLQKFGQSFLDRLKGRKLNSNLLRKVTIVDTPGILENRKTSERTYPFNDACQWFIDRADIIYVVYDPTKLDMGLEMEALFDQLKGRESHVRIVLNKADIVSPQELMRVQSTLLWNLSPLLGSSEPPTTFVGSFWSREYTVGSPGTLFEAQEIALLNDLRQVIVGRIENKISFTRRHAVRVRNHAKMVDCYLNNYYNHKTFFSNKKKVADEIVENPQNYHIYEGLSTLTNVSRYDLPDPDIYRDFFKVNPLYDFKQLTSTCSFFKGCPLDKLDNAISYDLPQLMGKYRKLVGSTSKGDSR